MNILIQLLAITLAATLFSSPAQGQDEEADSTGDVTTLDLFDEDTEWTKRGWLQFYASFGVTYLGADGSFSARLPDGKEVTIINFDLVGLDERDSSYWLTLNWRSATSRWGAWFGSWQYDVTGSRVWEDSLPIGGTETPVGASVTSTFDAKWYILEATYSFYRSDTVDTGIGIGFHVVDIDTAIAARFQIGDQEFVEISTRLNTLAPLPNVLAYVHWKFAPRWGLVGRAGYFGLDYSNFSGQMINAHAMVNYQLSPRWALGLSYQFVNLDLDVEKDNYTQVYDIDFSGAMVYARFSF